MHRLTQLVILALTLVAASPLVASASNWRHRHYDGCGHTTTTPTPSSQVPELDPNSAAAALVLLFGGALLIRERRRSIAR